MQVVKENPLLRWTASGLLLITGIINIYYGNFYAGFFENLWYAMGSIYIFLAAVIASNFEPWFARPAAFGYSVFLLALWATTAYTTGAGLDTIAYVDKIFEAVAAANMALLVIYSRRPGALN